MKIYIKYFDESTSSIKYYFSIFILIIIYKTSCDISAVNFYVLCFTVTKD